MFVESTETSGSLFERCDDFRKLRPREQTAQVQYLWPHWLKLEYLKKLSQHGNVVTHPAYARVKKKYDDEMRNAQRIWERKFGGHWDAVAATGKRFLELVGIGLGSAKRRRR